MADKILTTKNKKIIMSAALLIAGWHALVMGSNPLSMPQPPAFITNPLLAGFSLLTIAGALTIITVFMLWFEY